MPPILSRYATPLVTGLFLVSLITGVALFLHVGPAGFHPAHEILSLVLIVPFVLHIWKNWKPMACYLRHAPMAVALILSVVMTIPFLIPQGEGGSGGRPPQFALAQAMLAAPVDRVAPVLDQTPASLVAALEAAGFGAADATLSLAEIAAASGRSEAEVARAVLSLSR